MDDRSLLHLFLVIAALSLAINGFTLSELRGQAAVPTTDGPPANAPECHSCMGIIDDWDIACPWIGITSGCKECTPCENDCEEISRKYREQQIEEALRLGEEQGFLDEMTPDELLEEISWELQQHVEANRTACEKQVEQCIADSKTEQNACFRGCREAKNTCLEPCRQGVIEWIEVEKADGNEVFLEAKEPFEGATTLFFLPEHFSGAFGECLHCFDEQEACVEQCPGKGDTCTYPCPLAREKWDICKAAFIHRNPRSCLWTTHDRCFDT